MNLSRLDQISKLPSLKVRLFKPSIKLEKQEKIRDFASLNGDFQKNLLEILQIDINKHSTATSEVCKNTSVATYTHVIISDWSML